MYQKVINIYIVLKKLICQNILLITSDNKQVIIAAGTGNPYFSTDTGALLRAAEIHADVAMLAKNIDGVYDSDPNLNPDAKKFESTC